MQIPLSGVMASLFVDLCDSVLCQVLEEAVTGQVGEVGDTGPLAALIPQAGHLSDL